MGMTMTQKILAAHAGLDKVEAGQLISAKLDLVLGNDITTPVAVNEFRKAGFDKIFDKDKVAIVLDHFVPNKDIKAAEQSKQCREFACQHCVSHFYDVGKMGIEQVLESYLSGKDGYTTYQTDADGFVLPGMKETTVSATNGANVTLTLNKNIQETLEQSFATTNETFHPDRIWGAVVEVDTGKVIAWGQSPSFDPNTLDITDYSNYGSQVPYEPGSTLKTFTWAATINEGKYDSNATAEGYRYCYVSDENNNPVRTMDTENAYGCVMNYHNESYSNPTLDDGLKYSLNTVAATLENEYITPDILLDYLNAFGFFSNVNTDGILEEAEANAKELIKSFIAQDYDLEEYDLTFN